MSLRIRKDLPTNELIGKALKDLDLPEACLIAMIQRKDRRVIPSGLSILEDRDRLIIIGEPVALGILQKRYDVSED